MKKYISILLSILIIFSITACSNDTNNQNMFVEAYKDKATQFVESGDLDSAIKVLEEGILATDDEELKEMLNELQNDANSETSSEAQEKTSADSSESDITSVSNDNVDISSETVSTAESEVTQLFDMTNYIGWWTEKEDVYTNGGMWLDIFDEGGNYLSFYISLAQMGGIRTAETHYIPVLKEDITSNKVEITFSDSFGNCGVANIEFLEDKIICTISNFHQPYGASDWGIYDGEYILTYHGTEH